MQHFDYQGEKFKIYLSNLKKSKVEAANMLGISRSALYDYFESKNLSRETVQKITTVFNASENDIWGDNISAESQAKYTTNQEKSKPKTSANPNAKFIGNLEEAEEADGNTKFVEISPGRYRMKVDFIPLQARAGYLATFGDSTIYEQEEFPKHEVTVSVYHKGKYKAFEVAGDSMDDGTINSIPSKTIITCRELPKHYWTSNFHTHNYKYWVFIHKQEGILVKTIKYHNPETGEVTLSSLNPDKSEYPDINVDLDDVYQILNVCKREME